MGGGSRESNVSVVVRIGGTEGLQILPEGGSKTWGGERGIN